MYKARRIGKFAEQSGPRNFYAPMLATKKNDEKIVTIFARQCSRGVSTRHLEKSLMNEKNNRDKNARELLPANRSIKVKVCFEKRASREVQQKAKFILNGAAV